MAQTAITTNSRSKFSRLSYSTRIIFVATLGIHLPIFGFVAFLSISQSTADYPQLIAILLLFTVGATLVAIPTVNRILNPIRAGTKVLEEYYSQEKLPQYGTNLSDKRDLDLERLQRTIISLDAHVQEKKDLSALLSQDLRQPFSQMMGIMQIIKLEDDRSKIDAYCNQMIVEGKKQLNFLEYVVEELDNNVVNTAEVEKSYIMLNELITTSVDKISHAAQKKGVSFMIASRCNILLELETERTIDAIVNILANSVKFSFAKGIVKIRTQEFKEGVEITISDTGMGFETEERKALFKRFVRTQSGTQGETSLDHPLYKAKQDIEMQGGTIEMESLGRGKGSSFKISLPAHG